jgi:hypothetical protein
MKPKKISYKIEEPCHADWGRMQPEAQGRFCSSCSKTVVDFSSMSDFSIVNYLEKTGTNRFVGALPKISWIKRIYGRNLIRLHFIST